jgi:SPP1 family predicted phage head-tail adaptor
VELLRPVDAPDGMGGASRTLAPAGFAWARVETIRRRETVETERATGLLVHRITMRARDDVASGMIVRDGDRFYRVVTVEFADESRRYLELIAEEEEP